MDRVWANSGKWWRIGQPGLWQSMGSRIVEYDWMTEQQHGKPDIKLRNSILGKFKNLGLLKSFHSEASQLYRASSCCIFFTTHILPPLPQLLSNHYGVVRHLLDHRLCFPFGESSFTFRVLWLLHPCLLIWQKIFHFTLSTYLCIYVDWYHLDHIPILS